MRRKAGRGGSWLAVLAVLPFLAQPGLGQQAPFLEVLPAEEQVRQLELRADLLMIRKKFLEAIDVYQQAIDYDPRNVVLLNKLGIAHHQVLDLAKAEKFYRRATKADKNYAQAWNNLGTVHYGRKSLGSAVKFYKRALLINPADASIRSNLGTALVAQRKFDDALLQYRLALMVDPEVFDRRGGFGVVLQERSVEDRGRFFFVLAKTYITLGFVTKGMQFLRRALESGVSIERAEKDDVFAGLHDHPDFLALKKNPPVAVR